MLLGAKYGPCMRRDRRLFEGLESSFMREANQSGCCVRRDSSGCVQVPSAARCPVSGDHHVWYYVLLLVSVVGTIRRLCVH